MTKAEIEGDVDEAIIGGEVEESLTTLIPDCHELCERGRHKLGVVHTEDRITLWASISISSFLARGTSGKFLVFSTHSIDYTQ